MAQPASDPTPSNPTNPTPSSNPTIAAAAPPAPVVPTIPVAIDESLPAPQIVTARGPSLAMVVFGQLLREPPQVQEDCLNTFLPKIQAMGIDETRGPAYKEVEEVEQGYSGYYKLLGNTATQTAQVEGNIKKLFHDYGVEGLILITTINVPSITVQGVEILIDDVKKENKDLKVDILVWAVETAGIDDCGHQAYVMFQKIKPYLDNPESPALVVLCRPSHDLGITYLRRACEPEIVNDFLSSIVILEIGLVQATAADRAYRIVQYVPGAMYAVLSDVDLKKVTDPLEMHPEVRWSLLDFGIAPARPITELGEIAAHTTTTTAQSDTPHGAASSSTSTTGNGNGNENGNGHTGNNGNSQGTSSGGGSH